ncbi:MAG: glycosyltransferase [Candidatus Brocadiales bacterium]|nr:glycosyltransferase [Candidatus Bathyanammoxibius amoris]
MAGIIRKYTDIVGESVIEELFILAERFGDRTVQNVNSTAVGGGVAEILNRMVPLLNELGVSTTWDVIKGGERFFEVTKKMHNALHACQVEFTPEDWDVFAETTEANVETMDITGDVVFIHDSQPIGLIKKRRENDNGSRWVWRCHVDFSSPDPVVWKFLKKFIEKYDASVFSAPQFSKPLKTRQALISPSIDPLSPKNRELKDSEISGVLERFNIDPELPIITQISRFDYLKDPVGVVEVYRIVKKNVDCQLILAGGGATDDPEGEAVLAQVREAAGDDPHIHVLLLPPASDIEINALQRASAVVLQKSLREGFGLTVAEALWKSRPVVASAVGGIPLQIAHEYSGLLSYTIEGTAFWVKQILQNPELGEKLGRNGREHIRNNFLITRHIREYLLLFHSLYHEEDVVHL